jgi:hypothetical protein
MILLRCAFLLNDNPSDNSEEKKKPKISQKEGDYSPNLDQAIENKVDTSVNISLKERIELHQSFFQFYGKNFSPLMAGIIIEQCEVVYFSEKEKKLIINVLTDSFQGSEELKQNFNKDFELDITVKKNIENLESIKILYKKELIEQETKTDDFKKVLAKFPNAKIIDIEDIERGDENDG